MGQQSKQENPEDKLASDGPKDVGLTFVEMMFAVAVGDTASQVAKVMQEVQKSPKDFLSAIWDVSPSLMHLLLVLIVIATSWVGWYHSSATRKYMSDLKDIFPQQSFWPLSFPFFMLLLDVFLVVCYFVLSEGVELPVFDVTKKAILIQPSVLSEVQWMRVVMATYLVWNICIALHARFIDGSSFFANQRGWRMFAAIVSLAIVSYASESKWHVSAVKSVVMVDAALLLAVLIFRLRLFDNKSKYLWQDWLRGGVLVVAACWLIWAA